MDNSSYFTAPVLHKSIVNKLEFKHTTIVGLGLIGGSLAAAFKRKHVFQKIIGVDHSSIIEKALKMGLIDEGFTPEQNRPAVQQGDLIFLATPIGEIVHFLKQIGGWVKPGSLITDVGSTKAHIVETANQYLPNGIYFLGGHPMTGAEKQGVEQADPFLFENAVYVLTNSEQVPEAYARALVEILETIGAKILFLPAQLHDEIAAVISHLPQMLAVALMNFVHQREGEEGLYLKLAAGGFRDMTRVASSPFEIWKDILQTNQNNIRRTLDEFIQFLQSMREWICNSRMEEMFQQAAYNRLAIPKDTRGFLRPHFDISIIVEDKPGMIAAIAEPLAKAKINIKDIEVLKVREGEAGTLRLAFESEEARQKAMQILTSKGFKVTKRM